MNGFIVRQILEAKGYSIPKLVELTGLAYSNIWQKLSPRVEIGRTMKHIITDILHLDILDMSNDEISILLAQYNDGKKYAKRKYNRKVKPEKQAIQEDTSIVEALKSQIDMLDNEIFRLKEELSLQKTKCNIYKNKYDNVNYLLQQMAQKIRENDTFDIPDEEITEAELVM